MEAPGNIDNGTIPAASTSGAVSLGDASEAARLTIGTSHGTGTFEQQCNSAQLYVWMSTNTKINQSINCLIDLHIK